MRGKAARKFCVVESLFPGSFRNRTGNSEHRALFGNSARLRLRSISSDHIVDVCRNCGWNERPIFAALCATGLAALSAKAGTLDAPREAIHGVSAPGDTALPALRARRATRPRGRDLGELFSALRE